MGALGRVVDEAPGSVSYHLTRLAEVGLVEEAPGHGSDGRQRWWRAAHQITTTPAQDLADPERAAASTALREEFARRLTATTEAYLDAEPTLPVEWVAAATSGDRQLHLAVEELAELSAEVEALSARWEQRSAAGRDGTRPVVFVHSCFPRP